MGSEMCIRDREFLLFWIYTIRASDLPDMINRIPMRRVGDFSEMDGPLLLLVSDAGSYITGETIIADGGHLLREI